MKLDLEILASPKLSFYKLLYFLRNIENPYKRI